MEASHCTVWHSSSSLLTSQLRHWDALFPPNLEVCRAVPWYFSNPHGRARSLSARELCCLGEVISAHQCESTRGNGWKVNSLKSWWKHCCRFRTQALEDTHLLTVTTPITPEGHEQPPSVRGWSVGFADKLEDKFFFLSFFFFFSEYTRS